MTIVFIISAPSGSGKSTLVHRLLQQDPRLTFSISYTTRPPRGKEEDGKDYHFITRDEFLARLERGEFLEHAGVFGHFYGTHISELERAQAAGLDLVLDIDVQGARQLKSRLPDAVTIFILAPSRCELEERLRARSEDAGDVIRRRLREAAGEIGNYQAYDYVVINRDVEEAADLLRSIVRAERARREQMDGQVLAILETFKE